MAEFFSNAHGSLQQGSGALLWCFDLLYLNGDKLMLMPLDQRKGLLGDVVSQADDEHLQFSGDFDDPILGGRAGLQGVERREADIGHEMIGRWREARPDHALGLDTGRADEPRPGVGQVLLAIGAVEFRLCPWGWDRE